MPRNNRVKVFSLKARLAELRIKNMEVKRLIADELKRPLPCSLSLQQLKRRKLELKDQMLRYDGLLRTLSALSPSQSPHPQR
ncbi:YdcH family protein [Ruegeria arenilitoris]|uniref:YdcH family protein n=1 Tax=Ruegeria arenilitoris TaxID=1173585 RepID=UPI00147D10AD|nr:YdcH family protein [Ruegeria arenilitoris]